MACQYPQSATHSHAQKTKEKSIGEWKEVTGQSHFPFQCFLWLQCIDLSHSHTKGWVLQENLDLDLCKFTNLLVWQTAFTLQHQENVVTISYIQDTLFVCQNCQKLRQRLVKSPLKICNSLNWKSWVDY